MSIQAHGYLNIQVLRYTDIKIHGYQCRVKRGGKGGSCPEWQIFMAKT
jgi:hypothetical protein